MTRHLGTLALVAAAAVGLLHPRAAAAQTAKTGADDSATLVERGRAKYQWLRDHGGTVIIGSIFPGSSLAFGGIYQQERLLGTNLGASIRGAYSIRGYHELDLSLGHIKGREHRAELGAADADLTRVFNDHDLLAFGTAFFVDARQIDYPRVDFFGLGQDSNVGDRSDFRVRGASVDLVGQWQPNSHLGLSGRLGILDMRLKPGTNDSLPNTQDVFTDAEAPGLSAQHRYHVAGIGLTLDYRDRAQLTSKGSFAGVALWRSSARDVDDPTLIWTRLIVEGRHFIRLHGDHHVVALRALASARLDDSPVPMPFYLQPTLGGSKTMRGFGSYRLRGDAAWTMTAEYRWRAHKWVEIAPFIDSGAVADRFARLGDTHVEFTPGIGARATTSTRVITRVDLAHGRDGTRMALTLSTAF